jgi:CheY-like chemotaxis protein
MPGKNSTFHVSRSAPVLYAEDEPNDVFFMRFAWEEARVPNPLVVLKDGQQAIDYLAGQGPFADREKHPLPCLLLLDLNLPLRNGFDVLRWIREHPALASLKVVIVSGSEMDSDMAMARSLGITEYVVKPSSLMTLLDIIEQRHKLWLTQGT